MPGVIAREGIVGSICTLWCLKLCTKGVHDIGAMCIPIHTYNLSLSRKAFYVFGLSSFVAHSFWGLIENGMSRDPSIQKKFKKEFR